MNNTFAAIDIGTNTTRLLVQSPQGTIRMKWEVGLGADLEKTGIIGEKALEIQQGAFKECARFLQGIPADHVRATGTSAVRDATNAEELQAIAQELLNRRIDVISGPEEAALAYAGAALALPPEGETPVLVVDIGGGSTELTLGDRTGIALKTSLDVGSRRMTGRLQGDDRVTVAASVAQSLATETEAWPLADVRNIIGIGGTVETLAAVINGEPMSSDAPTSFDVAAVADATDRLFAADVDGRCAMGVDSEKRAKIIPAGGLILQEVLHCIERQAGGSMPEAIIVSPFSLTDGVVAQLRRDAAVKSAASRVQQRPGIPR